MSEVNEMKEYTVVGIWVPNHKAVSIAIDSDSGDPDEIRSAAMTSVAFQAYPNAFNAGLDDANRAIAAVSDTFQLVAIFEGAVDPFYLLGEATNASG